MMIKSLSRCSKSFGQLVQYLRKEGSHQGKSKEEFFHNLPFLNNTKNGIVTAFQENAKHLKHRKNGVVLYHEILSLHPDDREQVTPQMLSDIAQHYLTLRAPEGLGYGRVHTDTKNPHIHLMLSANVVGSAQKIRLSKRAFARVKQQVKLYLERQYPQLENTLGRRTRRGTIPCARVKKIPRSQVLKKSCAQEIQNFLKQSSSLSSFEEKLQKQGSELYTRGKQCGVIWKGKKYRLKTLGLDQVFDARKEDWLQVEKRKQSVHSLYLKKFMRNWKEQGFREKILSTLQHHKNQHLEQLQKITKRKQGRRGLGVGHFRG